MSGVTHVAAGAAIGFVVNSPGLGFALGLASHALMDLFPHRELFGVRGELWATFWGSLTFLALAFAAGRPLPVAITALGSTLPDLEIVLRWKGLLSEESAIFPTHNGLLPQQQSSPSFAVITQSLIVLAGLAVGVMNVAHFF